MTQLLDCYLIEVRDYLEAETLIGDCEAYIKLEDNRPKDSVDRVFKKICKEFENFEAIKDRKQVVKYRSESQGIEISVCSQAKTYSSEKFKKETSEYPGYWDEAEADVSQLYLKITGSDGAKVQAMAWEIVELIENAVLL